MKQLYFFIAILSVCGLSMSAKNVTMDISGYVVNVTDSIGISNAVLKVTQNDETVAIGHSMENGYFEIKIKSSNNRDDATLVVTKEGYMNSELTIPITKNETVWVGGIFMHRGTTLDEITVDANMVMHKNGSTIVYPSSSDVQSSYSSLDLFMKLPLAGLDVNPIDRTLTAKGGAPYITIDGVPSTIDDVRSLQPKDILRVDFTGNPPARYLADGYSSLLEIFLKQRSDGGSVFADISGIVTYNGHADGNIAADYHEGKSQFKVNYDGQYNRNTDVEQYSKTDYIGANQNINIEENLSKKFWYFNNNLSARYNYRISNKSFFASTFRTNINDGARDLNGTTHEVIGDVIKNYNNTITGDNKKRAYALDTYYKAVLNDKTVLETQIVGTYLNQVNNSIRNYYLNGPDQSPAIYNNSGESWRKSIIGEVQLLRYTGNNSVFTAGYKASASDATNSYAQYTYNPRLGDFLNNLSIGWQHQINQFYYTLSTGLNYNIMKVDNKTDGKYTNKYFSNYSNISCGYSFNDAWNLNSSCSLSSQMPTLTGITDYEYQLTPYLWTNGNRELKPSHNLSGNIQLNYTSKHLTASLNTSVGRNWNSQCAQYLYESDKNRFLLQTINLRNAFSQNNSLEVSIKDFYGFGIKGALKTAYGYYRGSNFTADKFSLGGSIYTWWNKGPVTISYRRNFSEKNIYGSSISTNEVYDKLSLKYTLNKNWSFYAGWSYMFSKNGWTNETWNISPVAPSYSYIHMRDDINSVTVGFTYSGDFGKMFEFARRRIDNTDEGSSLRMDR